MGLESLVKEKTTHEKGMSFIDRHGNRKATISVGDVAEGKGMTAEIEILRGDLATILVEASLRESKKDGNTPVEYFFGDFVEEVLDAGGEGKKVRVRFSKEKNIREFDMLAACDGQGSKIRSMVFDSSTVKTRDFGQYIAYFTIPKDPSKDSEWSSWYNAPGSRLVMIRPDNKGFTRAYLAVIDGSLQPRFKNSTIEEQKNILQEVFKDAGWEAPRVLEGMKEAKDFYMQQVLQIKLEKWHTGRIVCVGDAGYCPSPISGMGTTVGIVGAYSLAGEIANSPGDLDKAFESWEQFLRPFVKRAQKLPPGGPKIANPKTAIGISVMGTVVKFVSESGLIKVIAKVAGPPADKVKLPAYTI